MNSAPNSGAAKQFVWMDVRTGKYVEQTTSPKLSLDERRQRTGGGLYAPDDNWAAWEDSGESGVFVRIHRRTRPDPWWGVVVLSEFWAAALLASALCWSLIRDQKQMVIALVGDVPPPEGA